MEVNPKGAPSCPEPCFKVKHEKDGRDLESLCAKLLNCKFSPWVWMGLIMEAGDTGAR